MKERLDCAVLGGTGIVGQTFLWMLADHPWFRPAHITASSGREGKRYGEEVRWQLPFPVPGAVREMPIHALDVSGLKKSGVKVVFSALPADVAKSIEPELRDEGFWVFSNAGAMRREPDVPILIPEINLDALDLIHTQGFPKKGFVVTNANCTVTGLVVALAALQPFGIREVTVSSYQAISGAGYPGLSAMDILNNILPYIPNEEDKLPFELKKILDISCAVYPYCIRVPTLVGHLESVWATLEQPVTAQEVLQAWKDMGMKDTSLPSSPENAVVYCPEEDAPQTRMSFLGSPPGMPVFTGRLKVEKDRVGFILLANNLVKGAAGGSVQNAEAFLAKYGDEL